jgi:hypothetical protein
MADRQRERAAVTLFINALRVVRSLELAIAKDNSEDFPDFVLSRTAGGSDVWVEVVEAIESGQLLAAERRAQRLYDAAAREYRSRGEEVVLTVSPQGVDSITPSPGFGVSGVLVPGPARRISPPEWVAKALEQKGRGNRYGLAERARTTLLIDCSREVLIDMEDAGELRESLSGNTLGFTEVWSVSANWSDPRAVRLAP